MTGDNIIKLQSLSYYEFKFIPVFKYGFDKECYTNKDENYDTVKDYTALKFKKVINSVLSASLIQLKKKPLLVVLTMRIIFSLITSEKITMSDINYHQCANTLNLYFAYLFAGSCFSREKNNFDRATCHY